MPWEYGSVDQAHPFRCVIVIEIGVLQDLAKAHFARKLGVFHLLMDQFLHLTRLPDIAQFQRRRAAVGGLQDNAIPREAEAVLLLKQEQVQAIQALLERLNKIYSMEYECVEENITISLLPMKEKVGKYFSKETTEKIISILLW